MTTSLHPLHPVRTRNPWAVRLLLLFSIGIVGAVSYALLFVPYWKFRHAEMAIIEESGPDAYFLSGYYAFIQGDWEKASEYFHLVLPNYQNNPYFLRLCYEALLHTKGLDAATELLNKYSKAPETIAGYLPYIVQDIAEKQYHKALGLTAIMQRKEENDILLIPFLVSWCQAGKGKWQEAIAGLEALHVGTVTPLIQFHLALLYELSGHPHKALDRMSQAVEGYLYSYDSYAIAANFFARHRHVEKAKTLYQHYRNLYPFEDYFAKELAGLEEGKVPAPLVQSPKDAVANLLGEMAAGFLQNRLAQPALMYVEFAEYLQPNTGPWLFLKGRILEANDQYAMAIETYHQVPEQNDFYVQSQVNSALATYKQGGETTLAIQSLQRLEKHHKHQPDIAIALADIYMQEKRFTDAIAVYSRLISHSTPSAHYEWPLYFLRGIAYDRAGQWTSGEADLVKALELNSEQVDVLNYLGYSWLERGTNLKRAAVFIQAAYRQRPLDPAIMDSMAWVLYHMRQYEEAQALLEKSLAMQSDDPVIHEHLGDVYWQLRHFAEARFEWQHALSHSVDPEEGDRLRKKLTSGVTVTVPYIDANLSGLSDDLEGLDIEVNPLIKQ